MSFNKVAVVSEIKKGEIKQNANTHNRSSIAKNVQETGMDGIGCLG